MRRRTVKLFALLLTVIMILCLLPGASFAQEFRRDKRKDSSPEQPQPSGYIPVEIPGTRAVTDAYLSGDMDAYYRLSGITPKRDTLPSSYNSDSLGYVTSVKNQNPYGSCWAHAAAACVETYMIKNGVPVGTGAAATTNLNISETQHCFFNYSATYDAEGMLTGDKTTLTGSESCLEVGGNGEMSAYTLQRWTGAASESVSALQYSKASTVERSGLDSEYAYGSNICHVQNSEWIPGTDVDAVKRAIMQYGAGNISYYETGNAYTYICTIDNTSQSSSSHKQANHAITVVGWDDSIAVSNFKPNKPSSTGAWICKNSWGTSYFNRGYCYISYEDTTVCEGYIFFYDAEPVDNYDHNYQYDGTCNVVCYGKGWSNSIGYYEGFANDTKVANIFTAQGNEYLEAIAFCNWDEALTYTAEVYKNPTAGNPASGTLVASETGYLTFSGYYTVPLTEPVRLSAGDTFSVVISQSVPVADDNGKYIHTPYDATFSNTDVVDFCNWTHANHGNTSYYKEPNGSWTDCPENGDYRIKAFTSDAPAHEHTYGDWTSNNNGTHSRTCSGCGDVVTENCTCSDVVTAPTATAGGFTTHTCTVCGYSYTDSYTDPLGYTVTFSVPAGVTAPAAMNCQAGGTITLPAADAPNGYTFLGWVTEDYNNVSVLPNSILTGAYAAEADITMKALYSHTETSAVGYVPVTAEPDSWEGNYVVTCGNTDALYALKGLAGTKKYESQTAGGSVAFANTGMTLSDGVLTNVGDAYVFTVSASGGKFTVRNADTGTYLASKGGYLYSCRSYTASYCLWSLAVNEGAVDATNAASRTCPHLAFSSRNYFMINRAADAGICFWKQADGSSSFTVYTTVIG